jgi:hypothetical protein
MKTVDTHEAKTYLSRILADGKRGKSTSSRGLERPLPGSPPSAVLSLVREQPHEIGAEIEALGRNELGFPDRHASAVAGLPFHHHDPFDRALIAQCIVENLTFVTADRVAPLYPVKVLW